jgi:hypothetical protein
VWVARGSNALLLVLALGIMTQLGSIQEAWKATLVLGAGLGVATVLRWLWWRITAWGELAALVVSFAGAPLVMAGLHSEAAQMLGMASAATLGAVVVSLLGPATDPESLRGFAERARPPGFWGPYGSGHGPRALARALVATAAAAVTLYAVLVGSLRLLVPAPDTDPRLPWLLLAAGVAVAPLWLRALRSDAD